MAYKRFIVVIRARKLPTELISIIKTLIIYLPVSSSLTLNKTVIQGFAPGPRASVLTAEFLCTNVPKSKRLRVPVLSDSTVFRVGGARYALRPSLETHSSGTEWDLVGCSHN